MSRKPCRKTEQALIEALARGHAVAHAARMAGVSVRTAFRRLEEASFCASVSEFRSAMFEQTTGMLAATTTKAASTLENLLDDESSSIRLSAAKAVLEIAQRLREALDLETRLHLLEVRVRGGDNEFAQ